MVIALAENVKQCQDDEKACYKHTNRIQNILDSITGTCNTREKEKALEM